jgi:micrococcal nuclease
MRRRPGLAIFVVALMLAVACSSRTGRAPPIATTPAATVVPVTKVTDGDTIHVVYGGKDERVRLIGIDTPEVSWYGGHGGCFGEEAGLYLRGRLDGRSVRLEFDAELRDRYDRLLAYVFLGDELVNLTLVEQGYARDDRVPPDTARANVFAAAEREAKRAGRGLWSACPAK